MQMPAARAAAPLSGTIRLLRRSELPQFKAHLLRLDAESRRDRFNGPSNDSFVAAYADRCFHDGTIVIGYVDNGLVLGAAELHERPEEREPTGEIAFSVERELQHRGLGALLFARLIESARAFGYERLRVTTHPQNSAMKRLARRFNASLRFEDGETVGVIGLSPLPPLPSRPGAGDFVSPGAGAF
ncbi:GNAT family N-acetyltransferase [Mesorhizobium sp. CAU 1741]|uniref:GNAT family N-acetyltransferase n=1 Tax=Mesorhizobium sp. CAU 1741 TaxID=3140366 RepID=UPI00325BDEE3